MAPEDTNSNTADSSSVDTPGKVADAAAPDETTGASEPATAATPPRKRASRATKSATKKAAAPKAAATEDAAIDVAATEVAPQRTVRKAAAKATRTPRATRSATKKAAESVVQDVLPSDGAEGVQVPENAATVAEVAPVKKAVRKRATRKQAAPVVSSDASEAVRELVARSTTAAAADHDPSGVDATQLPEPSEEPTVDPLSPGGAAPSTSTRDAVPTEPDEETAEDAGEPPAGSAVLSVLFQAPDAGQPAARAPGRRRRAAAPAGAPGTHETAVVVTAEQPIEQDAPSPVRMGESEGTAENDAASQHVDEPTAEPESTESTEAVESTERPGRRSRSNRGGRTRRGRATSDADGASGAADEGNAEDSQGTTDGGAGPRHDGRGANDTSDLGDSSASPDADESDDTDSEAADDDTTPRRSRRRRGGKGRRGRGGSEEPETESAAASTTGSTTSESSDDAADSRDAGAGSAGSRPSEDDPGDEESASSRRRRRRRRSGGSADGGEESPHVSTRVRQARAQSDEPVAVRGSTRLEAKKQRRREGREAGRRRTVITEAEFLARREAVDRVMVVRNKDGRTQMGVLEDGVLVEHYIDQATNVSMAGNIYLGRVQNVLPSMEAAFVDIGKGRNAVLYAGEVNWDAAGLEGNQPKRIENALSSGQAVLVQVTKDPIGHKGARLTSQISLPGRYLVYVPNSSMTGISRKLPDTERARLKKILRDVVPESAGVIVRTAAEGATEAELRADVERLTATWETISSQAEAATSGKAGKSKGRKKNGGTGSTPIATAPALLHGEPDLTVRVIRDVFNEDFSSLVVSGDQAWEEIHPYITSVAPDLAERVTRWTGADDLFTHHRVDEQLAKAMDRKVWLPSGGSLVIDRTEAMTVVDVNTGKFVGSGGNLEETVTKNNIEAAEEIVRQLRLRDIGGIIVVDFIDMVLESNRDLVVRRLLECLGRDRTKHQVAEVTSLGLVQMTRKRVGSGLIEVFGETCTHCNGRGFIIHSDPVDRGVGSSGSESSGRSGGTSGGSGNNGNGNNGNNGNGRGRRGSRGSDDGGGASNGASAPAAAPEPPRNTGPTAAQIAAAAHAAALKTAAAHPVAQVAEAATSIADDVANDLASAASPIGIDRAIAAEISSTPDTRLDSDSDSDSDSDTSTSTSTSTDPDLMAPTDLPTDLPAEITEDDADSFDNVVSTANAVSTDDAPAGADTGTVAIEVAAEAAPRARRRRGRVVAPAGPPRAAGRDDQQPAD